MEVDEYDDWDLQLNQNSDLLLNTLDTKISELAGDINHESVQSIVKIVNEFETAPTLLDLRLTSYISQLTQLYVHSYEQEMSLNETTRAIGLVVYNLSKIRGFKIISTFFSSDTYMVLKILQILGDPSLDENEAFLNLIWLSNLVLVPFLFKTDMIDTLFDIGLKQLHKYSNGSKNQQCSLILMSKLLARPDIINQGYLDRYMKDLFEFWDSKRESEKLGHMMVLNKLMKICPEQLIRPYIHLIHTHIIQYELISTKIEHVNNLNMLYIIKLLCKLGEFFATQEKYNLLEDVLNSLVNQFKLLSGSFETTLRYAMAKSLSGISKKLQFVTNYHEQVIIYLLEQLDLKITIPQTDITAFEIINIDFDQISIVSYHTILLYLGYLALYKVLPKRLYPLVLSIVHRTLFTQQLRASMNISNQLKDSSSFVLWALIRSLDSSTFLELESTTPLMFSQVFMDLLEVTVFDKNLVIRKCGIAVLQEFIGRLGSLTFKTEDEALKGSQKVTLIELFTTKSISTTAEALDILDKVADIGIDRGLVLDMLIRNIIRFEGDFAYQKQLINKLNQFLKLDFSNELDIGLTMPVPYEDKIEERLSALDHSLYFICKLRIYQKKPSFNDLKAYFSDDYAEDYIEYLILRCENGNREGLESFFEHIRHCKRDVTEGLINLLETMSKKGISLSDSSFTNITNHLSLPLARSIFHHSLLNQMQFQALVSLMKSTHIDYEIRTELIRSLHKIQRSQGILNDDLAEQLISLLDDYTTTEQGDVGSKIRGAMLDLAEEFPALFKSDQLKPPLYRIAGEPIESLRYKAFNILCTLSGFLYQVDSGNAVYSFYHALFEFFQQNITDNQVFFWKGIIFSIAGLTGDSENIRESYRQFLIYLESLDSDAKTSTYKTLFSLITKQKSELQKTLKEYMHGLNLMVKLFESNVSFPDQFLAPLYAKSHNLQINCSNIVRVKLTLRVMFWLSLQKQDPKTAATSIKRILFVMEKHRSPVVREFALTLVYEFLLENMDPEYRLLEATDISDANQVSQIARYILNEYI